MDKLPIRQEDEIQQVFDSLKTKTESPDLMTLENIDIRLAYLCIMYAISNKIESFYSKKLKLPPGTQSRAIVLLYFEWLHCERDLEDFFNIPYKTIGNENLQSQ